MIDATRFACKMQSTVEGHCNMRVESSELTGAKKSKCTLRVTTDQPFRRSGMIESHASRTDRELAIVPRPCVVLLILAEKVLVFDIVHLSKVGEDGVAEYLIGH
jgi:hypothetical protein